MSSAVIKVENLGKLYRLGELSTGTMSHDLARWWARLRKREDPFAKIGESNDRTKKGESDYVWALKDINFEVPKGDVLGIIGRNGAGKSTLLKVLSKVTAPTEGSIKINGRVASLLEIGTGFHPELTGKENIYLNGAILGMTKAMIRQKFDNIVDFSGVARYVDTPVKRYSSGMYVRLAFAVAAFLEPEILIVDEVLAVGDAEFQQKCLGRMKDVSTKDGRTILFVSHQMNAVRDICNNCLLMRNGKVEILGPTDKVIARYLEVASSNEIYLEKELTHVKIAQVNDRIVLEATYKVAEPIDIPHLGFLISNALGMPIVASNPTIDLVSVNRTTSYKEGSIQVEIINPKLTDGSYSVTLWFGDSKHNFVHLPDCLKFEVVGMTSQKQLHNLSLGNVLAECKWHFQ